MTQRNWTDCEGVHRRDVLAIGSAGILGLTLPDLLRREARARATALAAGRAGTGQARSMILLWLAGGPATIDMWDLKPEAPEGIRGEFRPIVTRAAGVQICEHLPRLAAVMDRCTIVRSLYHTIPSHGPATTFMTTGNKPTAALQYPSMGSLISRLLTAEPGVPPYVAFSDIRNGTAGQSGYLGTAYNPFMVEGAGGGRGKNAGGLRVRGITLPTGVSLGDLEKRDRLLRAFDNGFKTVDKSGDLVDGLDVFHQQALDILRSDRTKNAFDLDQESTALRERYGTDAIGQGALAARRLIEAGVRCVTLSIGGWDTHGKNFESLSKKLLPTLDRVLSALIGDLDGRGLLGETLVMCAGEFGRTPKINKNVGRDHWARSMAAVVAGGGLKRGYAHGTTDSSGMAPASEGVTPDDLSATLFHCLGIDPQMELMTATGRPMQLFREGKIVEKLLG